MSAPMRRESATGSADGAPPPLDTNGRVGSLTAGIIGAGRVGATLGAALAAAGHRVVAASGGSAASIARLNHLLPAAAHLLPDDVARAADDLLIIAVPDDSLPSVVRRLAQAGTLRAGQVVAHTSGAHGLAVLSGAVDLGAGALALHPAMTFTGRSDADLRRLPGISYGVTADAQLRPFALRLVGQLGGTVEWIREADRTLYHAALAHGSNHLVTLVNDAMDRLREAGVLHPEKMLAPLLTATLDNALRLGDAALTGPVARGDAGTVAGHLERLTATAPDSVAVYRALARRTADRAIAAGRLRAIDAEPLLDVLADGREGATCDDL